MELLIAPLAEALCSLLYLLIVLTFNTIVLGTEIVFMILEMVLVPLLELFCKSLADTLKSRRKTSELPKVSELEKDTKPISSELPASIPQTEKVSKKKKMFRHQVAVWSAAVCSVFLVLFFIGVTVANTFFFESSLRFSLRQIKNRTNIAITFDKAEGNFWTGKIQLNNVSVLRQNHKISEFDLQGNNIELDLSMVNLLRWSFVFESVKISGFKGTWEQVGKSDKLKPRKNFRIDRLSMEDIQIDFTDHTLEKEPFKTVIKLDNMESVPLRSHWAMFDILFRSRGHGSVNGIPFKVDSEKGKHFCSADNLPVEFLAHYLRIFDWFDNGKVDLLIEDKVDKGEVVIHWSLILHDFHAKVPEEANLKIKAAALPLVTFLNLKSKHLPLEFELRIKEKEFQFQSTTELNDLVRVLLNIKIGDALKKFKDKSKKDE
jgi:hypothetical protein